MPFAQFAIDPKTVFTVMSEFTVPEGELKAFQENETAARSAASLPTKRSSRLATSFRSRVLPTRSIWISRFGASTTARPTAICGCVSSGGITSTNH